jgi:hypothetical protein
MCWLDTRFLSGWKVEIYIKENEFFLTFELTTKYIILQYILFHKFQTDNARAMAKDKKVDITVTYMSGGKKM